MTVKWIGDAAQELGLSPLDAVEILASRQEYPMNGLLDEDRFKTLRLMRGSKRLETSGSQPMPVPDRIASPSTVLIPTPPPHAPAAPSAAPAPRTAAHPPAVSEPFAPAPPPLRPPVGERASPSPPLQTTPARGGEKTVTLPPIEPKE